MTFVEGHKTGILIGGIVALLVAVGTVGGFFLHYRDHREKENEQELTIVQTQVSGFCEALSAGDIALAKQYCTEEASQAMALDALDADVYRATLLTGLGMSEEDLSDENRSNMDALIATIKTKVLTDYNCKEDTFTAEEHKDAADTATMTVTMTGCGSLNAIDFSGEIALAHVSAINYTTENQKTLMDLYDAEGVEAVRNNIKRQEVGNLLSAMNARMTEDEGMARTWEMTFSIEKDDEGTPVSAMITGAGELMGADEKAGEDDGQE